MLDMEKKVKGLKSERKYLKSENTILKESNDSNQFVIQKLNAALLKASARIKVLEDRMGEQQVGAAPRLEENEAEKIIDALAKEHN